MITVGHVYDMLNSIAPFETALPYDNPGLLVGGKEKVVTGIAVALDLTAETVKQAMQAGCNLMVSHHPVIFHPLKAVLQNTPVYQLVESGISAIAVHTNLDAAAGGVNDALCALLSLQAICDLPDPAFPQKPAIARIGMLQQKCSAVTLAKWVKQRLCCTGVRCVDAGYPIQRVAICGGAGGDLILPAKQAGADALVTADVRHHEMLLAKEIGLSVVDAGHYETESPIIPVLADRLRMAYPDLPIFICPQKAPAISL